MSLKVWQLKKFLDSFDDNCDVNVASSVSEVHHWSSGVRESVSLTKNKIVTIISNEDTFSLAKFK